MSELKTRLMDDMKHAMRQKNTIQLETIRMIRAAIQRKELDDRSEMDNAAVLQLIQKLVKQCNDAAKQFVEGDRQDLADKEMQNVAFMEAYLPEQFSDAEIDTLIKEAIDATNANTMKDMGKVVGMVKQKSEGRADMSVVSGRIKVLLS